MRYNVVLTLAAGWLAAVSVTMPVEAKTARKTAATVKSATPAEAAEPEKTAAPDNADKVGKPLTGNDPTIVDAAKTPLTDLNLGRDHEIPPILKAAIADPYTLKGLEKCNRIGAAVVELDEALGPDIDLPQNERAHLSEGRIARWAIASFIPFRGLIREVSGANKQDELVGDAIQAGQTRRGFLKGVGMAKKCKYPARPAPPAMVRAALVGPPPHSEDNGKPDKASASKAARDEKPAKTETTTAKKAPNQSKSKKVKFTSQPVVQQVP